MEYTVVSFPRYRTRPWRPSRDGARRPPLTRTSGRSARRAPQESVKLLFHLPSWVILPAGSVANRRTEQRRGLPSLARPWAIAGLTTPSVGRARPRSRRRRRYRAKAIESGLRRSTVRPIMWRPVAACSESLLQDTRDHGLKGLGAGVVVAGPNRRIDGEEGVSRFIKHESQRRNHE